MCEDKIAGCVYSSMTRNIPNLILRYPGGKERILKSLREEGYISHTWQYLKRNIADLIVECIVAYSKDCFEDCLREIYIADLTGGQHSYYSGHGGKDLDIIIMSEKCQKEIDESILEKKLEETVFFVLEEYFGVDFYKLLGIPNIVEIHVVTGPECYPYYQMIKNRSSALIKLWEAGCSP